MIIYIPFGSISKCTFHIGLLFNATVSGTEEKVRTLGLFGILDIPQVMAYGWNETNIWNAALHLANEYPDGQAVAIGFWFPNHIDWRGADLELLIMKHKTGFPLFTFRAMDDECSIRGTMGKALPGHPHLYDETQIKTEVVCGPRGVALFGMNFATTFRILTDTLSWNKDPTFKQLVLGNPRISEARLLRCGTYHDRDVVSGFGMIAPDGDLDYVFMKQSEFDKLLEMRGNITPLCHGDRLHFKMVKGEYCWFAVNVTFI